MCGYRTPDCIDNPIPLQCIAREWGYWTTDNRRGSCFLDGAVDDLDGVEEGHGGAEAGAGFFDRVGGFLLADAGELVAAGFVFGDELLGEGAVLDFVEQLA